jgi:hypothetical protein
MGRVAITVLISVEARQRLVEVANQERRAPYVQAGWMLERLLLGDGPAPEAPARRATRKGGG